MYLRFFAASAILLVLFSAPTQAASAKVEALEASSPSALAVTLSQRRFEPGTARHAVLARNDVFADALAGSALQAEGPLLFSDGKQLASPATNELKRALPTGGLVYLLGGTAALSKQVENQVAALGLTPVRLAGATRIETAAVIATEITRLYPDPTMVFLTRADTWPDAIAAGAVAARRRVPLLLTPSATLHPRTTALLASLSPDQTIVLGGEAALSHDIVAAVPNGQRIAGANRYGTAAAIAARFWKPPATTFALAPGDTDNGWAWGLAVAGTAHDMNAPLLYTSAKGVPARTAQTAGGCVAGVQRLVVVGKPGSQKRVDGPLSRCSDPDPAASAEEDIARELFDLANAERNARGLAPFIWDDSLAAIATEWSRNLAQTDDFQHRPDLAVAADLAMSGENIYSGEGWYATSGAAHSGWMRSEGHRNNLLQPGYALLGIGVFCDDNGTLYATQDFGTTDASSFDYNISTPPEPLAFSGAAGRRCP